jgi:hypothetical protein
MDEYLQGIDTREIVDTVHHRRPPVIPASAGLRPYEAPRRGTWSDAPTGTGISTLVQESRDPAAASAGVNTVASLNGALVPGQSCRSRAPRLASTTRSTRRISTQMATHLLQRRNTSDCPLIAA